MNKFTVTVIFNNPSDKDRGSEDIANALDAFGLADVEVEEVDPACWRRSWRFADPADVPHLLEECAKELDNAANVMGESQDQLTADICANLAMRCRVAVKTAVVNPEQLVKAASDALEYLRSNPPKGNIRQNFAALNHHENAIIKPLAEALEAMKGEASSTGRQSSDRDRLNDAAPDLLSSVEELINCIDPNRDFAEAKRARAAIAKARK